MFRRVSFALVLVLLGVAVARAESAREILDRRKALEDGPRKWADRQDRVSIAIEDGRGGERRRELTRFERRDAGGDETKTLIFFEGPAEVKGTGFLALGHRGRPAEQWLYLPELRRVRQIAPRSRNESFVGTDLTYADLDLIEEMPRWTDADAPSRLRGEDTVDGVATWVIELDPQREGIPYGTIVLWLAKDDLVPRRLEFLAEGATEPIKRVVQRDVRLVGAVPVAHEIEVTTLAKGSRTVIKTTKVHLDPGLADDLFTQRTLERGEP